MMLVEHRLTPLVFKTDRLLPKEVIRKIGPVYDDKLPKINLADKNSRAGKLNICMSNSFGFGGTNAVIIMGNKR